MWFWLVHINNSNLTHEYLRCPRWSARSCPGLAWPAHVVAQVHGAARAVSFQHASSTQVTAGSREVALPSLAGTRSLQNSLFPGIQKLTIRGCNYIKLFSNRFCALSLTLTLTRGHTNRSSFLAPTSNCL